MLQHCLRLVFVSQTIWKRNEFGGTQASPLTGFSDRDVSFMVRALSLAEQAQGLGEVPVGAVVVCDDQIVGEGYNRCIIDHDPTAHAEIQALRQAAQRLGNYRLPTCQLFCTLEPCAMCAGAIFHARLARVVFATLDPKTGMAGSVLNLFQLRTLNHHTQLEQGLCQAAAAAQLQTFFRQRRQRG